MPGVHQSRRELLWIKTRWITEAHRTSSRPGCPLLRFHMVTARENYVPVRRTLACPVNGPVRPTPIPDHEIRLGR
ncbi:hypothetical protein P8C59_000084 [Phyllachora maydis]|uniref:Uncharacterized protein n=1 Tax=Phyllachora maydis TaxID=1825666 RepID=A0AAD9HV52_9PEZI|nr:hypothetical protein P8C59_000084 [Phyllachora maydis]